MELSGHGGRVLDGCRVVTEFDGWKSNRLGDTEPATWRINLRQHRPDAFLWEHHSAELTAELDFANRAFRGAAVITTADPDGPLEVLIYAPEIC